MASATTSARVGRTKVNEPTPASEPPLRKKPSRWPKLRNWLIVLGVALTLLWLAPVLVAHSPLRNWIMGRALAKVKGTASVGSVSLGWFSHIEVSNLEVRDAEDQLVLGVPHAATSKTLLGLLTGGSDLGQISIDKPEVHLVVHAASSNVEDLISPLMQSTNPSSRKAFEIEVHGATITVDDETTRQKCQFEQIDFVAACTAEGGLPAKLETSGVITSPDHPGQFSAKLELVAATDATAAGAQITVKSEAFPLAALQPLLRRCVATAQLSGWLSCDVQCQLSGAGSDAKTSLQGQVAAENLAFTAPQLSGDELRLAQSQLTFKLSLDAANRLNIEQAELQCDVGRLAAEGSLPLTTASATDLLGSLLRENYAVQGQVDMARLSQLLPQTLHMQADTQVTAGAATIDFASRQGPDGHTWQANIQTGNLTAVRAGKPHTWANPVTLVLAAHDTPDGAVVDKLQCNSTFLRVQAAGAIDQFTASATCDLDQLTSELSEFIDWGTWRLAGKAQLAASWKRNDQDRFEASGSFQATNVHLAIPGHQPWIEPQLAAYFSASGAATRSAIERCEAASLTVQAGQESFVAGLAQPVDVAAAAVWQIETRVQTDLARWSPRLQPWFDLSGWSLGGAGQVEMLALCSAAGIEVRDAHLTVQKLHAWGGGLYIDEPQAQVQFSAKWEQATQHVIIGKANLATSIAVAELVDAQLACPTGGALQMSGVLSYQADVTGLEKWFHDPRVVPDVVAYGRLQGKTQIDSNGTTIHLQSDNGIEKLSIFDAASVQQAKPGIQPLWQEPQVSLTAEAEYASSADSLVCKSLDVQSSALHLQATGKIERLSTTCDAALAGQFEYDLPTLSQLLQPYWGSGVKLAGRESRKFSLHGPLGTPVAQAGAAQPVTWLAKLAPLTIETGLSWTSGEIYGMQLGQGQIDAKLAEGNLLINPLTVALSEGKLTAAPEFRLSSTPAEMTLGAGPILQDVHVTPEICASLLKFVAPALADSTRSSGQFSVALNPGARFPLRDPGAGEVSGRMAITSVEVLPGPTSTVLVTLARQIEAIMRRTTPGSDTSDKTLLKVADQNVDFRLADRKVYHEGLEFTAGTVKIRTHGWVGLDETLNLVADFPVQSAWLGNDAASAGFKGQVISVPIQGTLAHPRIDPRVLEQLAGQMLKNTANDILHGNVNQQLDKLFKPK